MLARTVSLVLIVATIACPLWCGESVCQADQCCPGEQSAVPDCCCRGCEQSTPDNDSQPPGDSPEKSSCQGVCGGAVLQKRSEWNDVSAAFFVSLINIEAPITARLVECNAQRGTHDWHGRGGNHGRSLCALHMSFLC